jgi:hypothetical protein
LIAEKVRMQDMFMQQFIFKDYTLIGLKCINRALYL